MQASDVSNGATKADVDDISERVEVREGACEEHDLKMWRVGACQEKPRCAVVCGGA